MPAEPLLFETAFPPNPLFCHTEFLEKLSDYRTQPLGKRQRLSVDERRLHYKATHGPNRGWRRSRLGGAGGSICRSARTWLGRAPIRARRAPPLCYRAIPDFDSAVALIREIGSSHPAADSLEWVARMQQLVAERPANFNRAMKPSEKRLLEKILE